MIYPTECTVQSGRFSPEYVLSDCHCVGLVCIGEHALHRVELDRVFQRPSQLHRSSTKARPWPTIAAARVPGSREVWS